MRARFKNLLRLILFALVCAILLGVFYIVYIYYIGSGPEIKVIGDLSVNYEDGKSFRVKNEKNIHFSIINNSNEAKYYFIEFKNIKGLKEAEYVLSDNNSINISDKLQKYNYIVTDYVLIEDGEKVDYVLNVKNLSKKGFNMEINIEEQLLSTNNFADVILKNNNVKLTSDTIVGKEEAITNEGLIKTTDDYGTAYFFRGKVDNNYVLINNIVFRVVKINGDGSVTIVLDGITDTLKKYYEDVSNFSLNNSSLLTYLNDWLNTNLYDYTSYITAYHYCDDTILTNNSFSSYNRLKKDNIASYVCLGNDVLSKIAMLTADDVILAGATLDDFNKDFYLYNENINTPYYLMTGATYSNKTFYPFIVSTDGKIINNVPGSYLRGIRPVITIAKTVIVTGNGSVNNPYLLT